MMKFDGIVHHTWEEGTVGLNRLQKVCLFPVSKNANMSLRKVLGCSIHSTHAKENLSEYIKVACVRDPADRVISAYLEILKLRMDSEREYTMELPFYEIENPEERFRQFIEDIKDNIYDTHLLPQVYQIYRASHVDYWIVFDNYLKDLTEFVNKYGINTQVKLSVRENKTQQAGLQERLLKMMREDGTLREHIRYEMYPEDTKLYNQIKDENKNI